MLMSGRKASDWWTLAKESPWGKEGGEGGKEPQANCGSWGCPAPQRGRRDRLHPTMAPWLVHRHSMLWHPPPPPGSMVPPKDYFYTLPPAIQTLTQATETSSRVCTRQGRSKGKHGRGEGLPAPSSAPVPRQLLKRPGRISHRQLKG